MQMNCDNFKLVLSKRKMSQNDKIISSSGVDSIYHKIFLA